VNGRDGDMRRAGGSGARDLAGVRNAGRYVRGRRRDVQQREIPKHQQPSMGSEGVSGSGFVNGKL
jgi:hypothetical protein